MGMGRAARIDIQAEEEIRNRVLDYIRNNDISQVQFAKLAGIDTATLNSFLKRKRHIGAHSYKKIAEALRTSHTTVKIDMADPNSISKMIDIIVERKAYLESEIKSTEAKLAKLKSEYAEFEKLEVKEDA